MAYNKKSALKILVILTASAFLASCGSTGGFNELLGIDNRGIDATNVEKNAALKNAKRGALPSPISGASGLNNSASKQVSKPKTTTSGITLPNYTPPKAAAKPKAKAKPKATPKPKPKAEPKLVIAPAPIIKVSPLAYKYTSLSAFRDDMEAGKMLNPLATAALIAKKQPTVCQLEGKKFICGKFHIIIE